MPTESRLVAALLSNAVLATVALGAGAVEVSGAVVGACYGVAVYLALGWHGYLILATFVVLGSVFTRVGWARKMAAGGAQENRGRRSWRNATANCAAGAVCAVLAGWTGEAVWVWAFVGSFAAALADTTESELGVLVGQRAYLPTTGEPVAPGTEGAMSPAGTLLGLGAAVLTAALAAVVGLLPAAAILPLGVAGLAATVVESWAGARWTLGNEPLNALTTSLGAALGVVASCLVGS